MELPMRKPWVYDLETYKDAFTMAIGNIDGEIGVLECSRRKNELKDMIQIMAHIKSTNGTMVGFNNIGFDYPILHALLNGVNENWLVPEMGEHVAKFAWDECQKIFNKPRGSFGIYTSDIKVHQTDLYLIHHFNNKSRSTGLKQLEFAMRMSNLSDLPGHPSNDLTDGEIDALIKYNKHDVQATIDFFKETKGDLSFRHDLTLKYGIDFTNFNDTKIGKQIFIMELEKESPGSCYEYRGKKKVSRGTFREKLDLVDVINPNVAFMSNELKAVLKWMKAQTLISKHDKEIKKNVLITKDVFTKVDMMGDHTGLTPFIHTNTRTELSNANTSEVIYTYRNAGSKIRIEKETKALEEAGCNVMHTVISRIAPNITATLKGFTYVFGLGGIHGSVENKLYETDDDHLVLDIDVASYYPSLAIELDLHPEHLGEKFCEIYKNMRTERLSYAKGTVENAALKLGLNGTYGDSNSKFSPMYDPAFTMGITLNGQLYLAALAELLVYQCDSLEMIQINTDGMTFRVKKDEGKHVIKMCKMWEKFTGMELEYQPYSRMWVADVNNYIAEKPDGELKLKGRYNHDRDWSQNHSELVVSKVAVDHLVNGRSIRDGLFQHTDMMDFMMFAKAKGKQRLELWDDDIHTILQNNCRYYVSMMGNSLKRINPPLKEGGPERPVALHAKYKVNIANDIRQLQGIDILDDIDLDYYMNEIEKITKFEDVL